MAILPLVCRYRNVLYRDFPTQPAFPRGCLWAGFSELVVKLLT
jgi:hypothetical protein